MLEFLLGHSLWAYRTGEFAFARGWSPLLLAVLGALAFVAIGLSLWHRRQLGLLRSCIVALLQFAFFSLLLIMVWRPVLNVERIRDRENVVAVLIDDSISMNISPDDKTPTRRQQAVSALQATALDRIAASSELRLFSFSDRLNSVETVDEIRGGAGQTRIGGSLQSVLQMAASVPLAAVVLVSDGAETASTLTEADIARLAATGVPIHTVGVGPESLVNDLELEQLQIAGKAVAGETLQAQVSIRHQKQLSTRIRIYDGGELIAAQEIKLRVGEGLTTVPMEFPVGEAGVRDLRLVLDPAGGETNTTNNVRRHVIDVTSRRRNVLYIEGEPRWEYKFVRRAAEVDRSLRLAGVVRATPNRYYRQGVASAQELADGFPRTAAELFAFDSVIIGSLEAAALSTEQHLWLKDFVDRRGGSVLLLAGRDGLADGGWGRVPLAQALPASLVADSKVSYGARASQARVTAYGAEAALGRLDADPARSLVLWKELPPLADFQTMGRLKPGAVVLLESVAGGRAEPLLVTQRYGRGASYLLATATTWRWQMRLPLADQRHETFWRQMLHTLTTPAPTQVSLTADRMVYEDESAIQLEAEVLDETFSPMKGARIDVTATADTGAVAPVRLESSGRDDGRFAVHVQASDPGLYRVELTSRIGEREVGRATTHVRREDGVVEQFAAYQHRAMLERIARETGGRYWKLDELSELPEAIRYSRAGMIERQTLDLWNVPLVFFTLILLKLSEWLLRRRWRRL